MIVDLTRPKTLLVGLCLFALMLAACGSDPEATLALPGDESVTSESDSPEETTPTSEGPSSTEVVEDDGDDQPDAEDEDVFTPQTVQFDPDNPPGQEELENLVFAAVAADFDNSFWCWGNTEICDVERHLGPAVVGSRLDQLDASLETYLGEGGVYKPGDLDAIYPVDVLAASDRGYDVGPDNEFRAVGEVVACEAYNGTYFVPNEDGTPKEVINDAPAGYITTFQVWQDMDGVLRVFSRAFQEEGGVEVCDPFIG